MIALGADAKMRAIDAGFQGWGPLPAAFVRWQKYESNVGVVHTSRRAPRNYSSRIDRLSVRALAHLRQLRRTLESRQRTRGNEFPTEDARRRTRASPAARVRGRRPESRPAGSRGRGG